MENGTWTFFCRDGAYDDSFRPAFRRYICHGVGSSRKMGADSEGLGQNRLTLRIREQSACLLDEKGRYVTPAEADIRPGDRVAAGVQSDSETIPCWRIVSVVPPAAGAGFGRGYVITAE